MSDQSKLRNGRSRGPARARRRGEGGEDGFKAQPETAASPPRRNPPPAK